MPRRSAESLLCKQCSIGGCQPPRPLLDGVREEIVEAVKVLSEVDFSFGIHPRREVHEMYGHWPRYRYRPIISSRPRAPTQVTPQV